MQLPRNIGKFHIMRQLQSLGSSCLEHFTMKDSQALGSICEKMCFNHQQHLSWALFEFYKFFIVDSSLIITSVMFSFSSDNFKQFLNLIL